MKYAGWFAGLAGLAMVPRGAHAQVGSVDGDYTSTALREDYTIQNWQSQCGPVPKSTSTGGGGKASIRETGGVLSIASSERSYRSSQCYDTMPTLKAEPAQHDATTGTWRVRCSTPEADPRKAVMNTLVAIGKNRVDVIETGRYEIRLAGGLCVADVRRSQAFTRASSTTVVDAGAPEPAASTTPTPPPSQDTCADPGPAQRFEISPMRKVAVAAASSASASTRSTPTAARRRPRRSFPAPTRSPSSPATRAARARKEPVRSVLVRVPEDAPEGAQTIAFQQGKAEASVSVEIVSKSRYDELFAAGELQALEDTPDGGASEPIRFTTPVVQDTSGDARKRKFLLLVGGLLGALALMGIVLGVRSRRAARVVSPPARPSPRPPAPMTTHGSGPPPLVGVIERPSSMPDRTLAMQRSGLADTNRQPRVVARDVRTCPVCANEFDPPLQFCPHDGAQLSDGKSSDAPGVVCPICRRGFDSSIKTCPDHGEELVPKTALGHYEAGPRKQAKICPVCGERFEGQTAFCGKDGTPLVVLN